MFTDPTKSPDFVSAITLLGQAARESRDNKYAQAAREIASLDLRLPPLTGPPHRSVGLGRGFIDILV
ncbi:MAG: hypothetical protein ACE5GA_06900 [Candidatus Zixiibacteriota bacterium]